jgi:NAD-dependent DNA ligase
MTDEIRNEVQKKNKLYAKAKKNRNAVEWEEFKDLRNKVTRMIRDVKNEYFAKHPEQVFFIIVVSEKDLFSTCPILCFHYCEILLLICS